jgi:hypothetical protein
VFLMALRLLFLNMLMVVSILNLRPCYQESSKSPCTQVIHGRTNTHTHARARARNDFRTCKGRLFKLRRWTLKKKNIANGERASLYIILAVS